VIKLLSNIILSQPIPIVPSLPKAPNGCPNEKAVFYPMKNAPPQKRNREFSTKSIFTQKTTTTRL
jgi:hypothetical protein